MRAPRLLGISGSIRRESYCTAILRTLRESLGARAEMTIFALNAVPIYNQDEDGPRSPAEVVSLRAAIRAADALVVVSPEYNHGIPGILKNALDWASRPAFTSVLTDKPVSVMTAAAGVLGGARAQAQLRETFAATESRVMANRQVVVGHAASKIVDGRLVDKPTLDFALGAIDILIAEVRMLDLARSANHAATGT